MARDSHQIPCRILPIIWTSTQFEERHRSITAYAKELIERNSAHSIDVDKEDVIPIWWLLVDRLFPKGDPDRDQYMSQIHCPSFHEFWAERDSHNGTHEQQDHEGFQRAERPTTRGERRAHPGVVVLVKGGLETLLPGVEFAALKDIEYQIFVRRVLEANPKKWITLSEMKLVWSAVVHVIFNFESRCVKEAKVKESMVLDSLNQERYDQLILDIRMGAHHVQPKTFTTLPIHGTKRPRETEATNSGSEIDDDDFVGTPEDDPSAVQGSKRGSKRPRVGSSSDTSMVLGSKEGDTAGGEFRPQNDTEESIVTRSL